MHGRHVKIVGKANPEALRSVERVQSLVETMIDRLGMRLLDKTHMYEVEEEIAKLGVEPFEDEGGVTGVGVLSTSHCAIHTWPLRAHFVMDVYSCRDFEVVDAVRAIEEIVGAYAMRVTDLTYSLEPLEEDDAASEASVGLTA
jgi:S-adenosylmethionine decarboxylase